MQKLALTIGETQLQDVGTLPTGGRSTLENIIQVGIVYLFIFAVIIALFSIVWGGFTWITSEGDKQRLAQARQRIAMAIVGLIIVFLSFLVINIVGHFFGVNLLAISSSRTAGGTF